MASPSNQNQAGGAPYDMHKFFNPSPPSSLSPPPSTTPSPPPPNPNFPNHHPLNPNFPNHHPISAPLNPNYPNPNAISAPFPPPSASFPPPTSGAAPFHLLPNPFYHHLPPPPLPENSSQPQRSLSFPRPPLQPPMQHQNPNDGARLMAMLNSPPSGSGISNIQGTVSGGSDQLMQQNMGTTGPMRMKSSKMAKGRRLMGENLVYDVDVRLHSEVQPQLEVTPITKYGSDPGLVLGRQIAVNKSYICYGLKLGAIRVLNSQTALRSLLKGLSQRVTDMAFFAEDVHLLASSSVDGRVYVWKITEGPDEEGKPQITGRIVLAVQIVGERESVHPRVCWHCHKQEVLVVGIGKRVLKIDTTKVGKGEKYSAEEPLVCTISKLIDGIQLVGEHDGEVTDLSMCQWMTTRLVSASVDGTIKIWEDRKLQPIAVLRPHDGQPVNSATFLAAADRPDHIILITGGPLNREIKIWSSASEEGWLLPSDAESWKCTQTLELKSSMTPSEDAFFNQVLAFPQTGLLLLANAKKNAIYAVHLDIGSCPAATRMDYLAEFTVTMPILSFTGTSNLLPHGEHVLQVYCVQPQAIQQYALDSSQCLPPPLENAVLEKSESRVSRELANPEGPSNAESSWNNPADIASSASSPKSSIHDAFPEGVTSVRYPLSSFPNELPTSKEVSSSNVEVTPASLPGISSAGISDATSLELPALPKSPRLSRKLSGFRSPSNNFELVPSLNDNSREQNVLGSSVDRQPESVQANLPNAAILEDESRREESIASGDDISTTLNGSIKFRHPTHLVTPSELLMSNSPSEVSHTIDHKDEGDVNIQDVVTNSELQNVEGEVNSQNNADSQDKLQSFVANKSRRSFSSQASDIGMEGVRDRRSLPPETYAVEESAQYDATSGGEMLPESSSAQDEAYSSTKDVAGRVSHSAMPSSTQQQSAPGSKGKKQKGKNAQESGSTSPSHSAFNSSDSTAEPGKSTDLLSNETASLQVLAMQATLDQLMAMQKDMQKQISVAVSMPVSREGKRLEAAIGRSMEKILKANSDALWARFQEESARQEKLAHERTQQTTNLISNCIHKDFPAVLEKSIKKELPVIGQALARNVVPTIEKTISTAIVEAFQKGVSDKAVNQLEKSVNSKLETSVARQIQVQFQTSGKQALQESLKSSLEASVIPAFEMSCKAMFEQVDTAFQKGMAEHISASQQKFESSHSSLAITLREAINSASSLTRTLSTDLAEGHRKLLAAVAVAGTTPNTGDSLVRELSNGPLAGLHEQIEAPVDPTKELSRMIVEGKFEEAFTAALQRSDVHIVSWLCSQVDLSGLVALNPLPLSQGVLLSLLQQLACDIVSDTPRKLSWMRDVLSAINPADPMIVVHIRPIFEQVYQILSHHRSLPTATPPEVSSIRLLMHVINSMLMTCK
ncbi:mRNA capping factor [Lithospermum erythrorhizon]|uniref:mRNA capping factor n=1 Tax=Lithospermum erythrorhizon TaxID=34254 RepID=A0AAV3RN53_LITER